MKLVPLADRVELKQSTPESLFPYESCFVALAFAAMLFVKHGDSRPQARSGIEALNYED